MLDAENVLEISPPVAAPQLLQPARQVARDAKAVASTQVDWRETSTTHIFKVDLPGVKKEQIKVQIVEGSALEICGERKKEDWCRKPISGTWWSVLPVAFSSAGSAFPRMPTQTQ